MNEKLFRILLLFNVPWAILTLDNAQVKISAIYRSGIYRIPENVQALTIEREQNKCFGLMIEKKDTSFVNVTPVKTCPVTWDRIKCWPETKAGESLYASCPEYIDGFKLEGKAIKSCMNDGRWFTKNGIPWTNYSNCRPQKNTDTAMHYVIIHTMGQIGYAVSIFALILASLPILSFRRLNCERNKMHVSLFVSFVLRAVMYNIGLSDYVKKETASPNIIFCRVMKATQNYAILANNTAVFIEALYLHNILFYHTFTSTGRLIYYVTLSWVLPAVVTLIWIVLRIKFDNLFCWDAHDDIYKRDFWLIQAFTITLTVGNLLLFIHLLKAIYSKMISQPIHEVTFPRRIMQSVTILIIVFGVYNLIFIPIDILTAVAVNHSSVSSLELVKLYCEHIISSCQGLLVSILFCFNNREVKTELRRWIFRRIHYFQNHQRTDSIPFTNRCNNRRTIYGNSNSLEGIQQLALVK